MRALSIILLLWVSGLQAQEQEYASLQILNKHIRQGQLVALKYNIAESNLAVADAPVFAVMTAFSKGKGNAVDTLMTSQDNKTMTASFLLPESVDAVVFKFLKGMESVDNNGGKGYIFPVMDAAGKPLAATNFSMAQLYRGDYYAGVETPLPELARKYLQLSIRSAIDAVDLFKAQVDLAYFDNDTMQLCALLNQLPGMAGLEEVAYEYMINLAINYCREKDVVNAIEQARYRFYPNGMWRYLPWNAQLSQAGTASEKYVWLQAFMLAFPEDAKATNSFGANNLVPNVMRAAARTLDWKTFDNVIAFAKEYSDQYSVMTDCLNIFVTSALRKDTLLVQANNYAKLAISLTEQEKLDQIAKPAYLSNSIYIHSLNGKLAYCHDNYASFWMKENKWDSAQYYCGLAANGAGMKNTDYNQRYFDALEKVKSPGEILPVMEAAIRIVGAGENLRKQYVRLAVTAGKSNPQKRLDSLLAEANQVKFREYKTKMINTKAPDFALVDLNGKRVSLASLKGKTVVVDFWAIWCKPCVASFPAMQKVVDYYAGRKDVKILFVNTWQNEPNKVALVKDFFEKKPFRFEVLMDTDNTVVKEFKITGIPSKFVIDKKGNIRFKSTGFAGDHEKTFEEMKTMIELTAGETK